MNNVTKLLSGILLSFTISHAFAGENVVLIVNEANQQVISQSDVKNIYGDQIITWDNGNRIAAYELPARATARETFSRQVLGKSAKQSASFWANKKVTNTGKNFPKTKRESSVISAVKRNPNAIGYVSEKAANSKGGIKILFSISE
jgi:ABC-type phosphate transport system substrate-binding protein